MFCINEPNIFFIGVVEKLPIIHLTYERQILLAKECIQGKITLPSKEEMLADYENEMKRNEESGQSKDQFYKFSKSGYSYWEYNSEMCNITSMPVDDSNYILLKDMIQIKTSCILKGNYLQAKEFDYGKYLKDIEFKPTSDKF